MKDKEHAATFLIVLSKREADLTQKSPRSLFSLEKFSYNKFALIQNRYWL